MTRSPTPLLSVCVPVWSEIVRVLLPILVMVPPPVIGEKMMSPVPPTVNEPPPEMLPWS